MATGKGANFKANGIMRAKSMDIIDWWINEEVGFSLEQAFQFELIADSAAVVFSSVSISPPLLFHFPHANAWPSLK